MLMIIFFKYSLFQATAESQGVFELRLKSFANKINKDSQGHCCDGYRTSSGRCSGACSTKFRVCLKHFQLDIDPSHECTFGEHVTSPGEENRGNIIQFPLDFKWPVSRYQPVKRLISQKLACFILRIIKLLFILLILFYFSPSCREHLV